MTDERPDPRFEADLRATLSELAPGAVPASLRASVAEVSVAPSRRPVARPLFALGAIAAVVVLAVVGTGTILRGGPSVPTVGVTPSASPVLAASDLHLELVADDPAVAAADLVAIIESRLDVAGFADSAVTADEGGITVDVPGGADARDRVSELVTSVGQVEAFGTGAEIAGIGRPLPDAGPFLFASEDVVSADLLEALSLPAGVVLQLDADATDRLAEYSSAHVGEFFAIGVDGAARVVPSINEAITDGELQISMADGGHDALDLIAFLRRGPLPTPLRVVEPAEPAPSEPVATAEPTEPAVTDPAPSSTIRPVDPATLRYECPGFPYSASLLDERRTDEQADTPIAAALREHLGTDGPDDDRLPDTGWTLVGSNDQEAEYVAWREDGVPMSASLNNDGGWRVTGWGPCHPRLVRDDGLVTARWGLAPGQDIGPDTMTFDAIVTERGCASGQPADDRIVGPDVFVIEDDVVVVFAVRPLPGAQTCQPNPSTRVTMALPEPLGERHLVDGADLPLRATNPTPTEGTVAWSLPVGADVGPATIEFRAVIRDVCDDGRAPDITTTPRQVVVTFRHDPDRPPEGCFVPSVVAIPVVLPEPLGDRELVDGSTLPQAGG